MSDWLRPCQETKNAQPGRHNRPRISPNSGDASPTNQNMVEAGVSRDLFKSDLKFSMENPPEYNVLSEPSAPFMSCATPVTFSGSEENSSRSAAKLCLMECELPVFRCSRGPSRWCSRKCQTAPENKSEEAAASLLRHNIAVATEAVFGTPEAVKFQTRAHANRPPHVCLGWGRRRRTTNLRCEIKVPYRQTYTVEHDEQWVHQTCHSSALEDQRFDRDSFEYRKRSDNKFYMGRSRYRNIVSFGDGSFTHGEGVWRHSPFELEVPSSIRGETFRSKDENGELYSYFQPLFQHHWTWSEPAWVRFEQI